LTPAGFVLYPHFPYLRHAFVRALALVEFEHYGLLGEAATPVLVEGSEEQKSGEECDEYDEKTEEERR
jgi:hypothetical protein